MTEAWLYDGTNAVRRRVNIDAAADGLRIDRGDGGGDTVAPALLVHVEQRRGEQVYGRSDVPGWRLGIVEPVPEDLRRLLPGERRYGRWVDKVGLVPAALIGLAVSAVVLFAGSRFPVWAAPYVPQAWEESYGDALVGDFGGKFCNRAEGRQALAKMAARLSPRAAALNIRVVDIPIVNAAALPGGNIMIFDELLKEAKGPEEVAGVLAHEIAHIERRHVTQTMIRELGLGMVVNAFGGNVGGNINAVLSASYSRDAEREADAGAIATLARAGISPIPTAAFFERLGRGEEKLGRIGEGLSYISTHPPSRDRQRLFRGSAIEGKAYAPLLSEDEWAALSDICWERPNPKTSS